MDFSSFHHHYSHVFHLRNNNFASWSWLLSTFAYSLPNSSRHSLLNFLSRVRLISNNKDDDDVLDEDVIVLVEAVTATDDDDEDVLQSGGGSGRLNHGYRGGNNKVITVRWRW